MLLRTKTLLTAAAGVPLLATAWWLVVQTLIAPRFQALEEREARNHLARLAQVMEQQANQLHDKAGDWGAWDEAFQFVQDGNADFRAANLIPNVANNMRLHEVAFLGYDGNVIGRGSSDLLTGHALATPPLDTIDHAPLIARVRSGRSAAGYYASPLGPLLLAARPVVRSDGSGTASACVVFIRRLDAEKLGEWSDLLQLPVGLEPWTGAPTTISPVSVERLDLRAALLDLEGQPLEVVRASAGRDIARVGAQTLDQLLYGGICVAILLALMLAGTLEAVLVRRLRRLSLEVEGLRGNAVPTVDGDDEIALLAKAVGDAVHRTTAASERATHEHRRFTALFQRSLDAVLMIEDGRVVEANRAAHDLLGTGLTGRQYVDLLPAPSGSRAAIRSHASPTSPARELALAGVDGQLIPVEIREIVMAIDGRDCLAVLIKDLREVRAAEREQRLLASVIDSTSDLVLILDVRGRPHSANGALRLALGRDPAEDWAADLMPPEQRERFRLVLEGARSNPWRGEAILAGIGPLPVSAVAFPIHDHQGEATHLALVMRDMRAEVEREAALHAAREEAEAAAKAKASFLAVMSHELRTPLNGVIGMASLLDRTPMSTTQADYVRTISVCAEGLLAQINDVLDLTRLESDGVVLEHLPIDVRTLAEDVLGICAPRAAEKGLELILDAPALPTVEGDPSRLRQALVNLVGNAVKFTPTGHVLLRIRHEPGRLQLAVEDTGIGMAPEVLKRLFTPFVQADESMTRRFGGTGLGLAISRRLVRLMGGDIAVHSATGSGSCFTISLPMSGGGVTPPANLRGLRVLVIDHRPAVAAAQAGLLTSCGAVVRRADRSTAPMPGEILLAAGDHPGTRALLAEVGGVGTVPLGYAEQLPPNIRLLHRPVRLMALQNALTTATPVPTPATATPASTGRPVVLVVEDNETNRLMVRAMLELTNCDVVDADNGLQALERLRTQRFDVVLMDGQMPILDGFEAVRQWRDIEKAEGRPRTPVVALTAMAMAGDDARCTAAGMDDYLTKPFTVDRLTAVIRRWVGHGA